MTDTPKQIDTGEAPHPAKKPKLYLIDIENLIGGVYSKGIERIQEVIEESIPIGTDDVVLVGMGRPDVAETIATAWPQAQCLIREGKDGADHDLLRELCLMDLSNFSKVVIASGDHIFAEEAARLQLEGFLVIVLSNRRTTSHMLYETGAWMIAVEDYCPMPDISYTELPMPHFRSGPLRRKRKRWIIGKHNKDNRRPILKSPLEEYWDDYGDREPLADAFNHASEALFDGSK